MPKILTLITRKILVTSVAIAMAFSSVAVLYAITWQTTPAGEPILGGFISLMEKSLVLTGASTDGIVKKASDTDAIGSGTMVANDGNIGV